MAVVYERQAKYTEALWMHEEVLKFRLKIFGPDHPLVADTQNNIAVVLRRYPEKYPEALKMYQKALKTRLAVLGPDHLHVGHTKHGCAPPLGLESRPSAHCMLACKGTSL